MDKNINNEIYNKDEDNIETDINSEILTNIETSITLSDNVENEFNNIVNRKLNETKIDNIENIDNSKNKNEDNKKICGYKNFKKELEKLNIDILDNETKDSFDESSIYSYETVDEKNRIDDPILGRIDKFEISYFYIISLFIGLFLLYYFYKGNIFITVIEFILLCAFPYIYIVLKIYISSKEIVKQMKEIKLN
jgi:hypothetical protein